jgi:rubrerythrin
MLLRFLEALIDFLSPINIVVLIIIGLFWEKQSTSLKEKIAELQKENKYLKERSDNLEERIGPSTDYAALLKDLDDSIEEEARAYRELKIRNGGKKMENINPKIVEIVDDEYAIFKCKVCGVVWKPTILTGGRKARGNWQCPNGCKLEK